MDKGQLGAFEEIVLLTVAVLHGEAYGVSIRKDIETRLERRVSIGAMQTALRRMEQKGFLTSAFGESTKKRGGKRKRYFEITSLGKLALQNVMDARRKLWDAIPKVVFE